MKKARIHPEIKKQIAKEFGVSYQTVTMSLDFVFNSKLSQEIRKRAIELLNEDIKRLNQ